MEIKQFSPRWREQIEGTSTRSMTTADEIQNSTTIPRRDGSAIVKWLRSSSNERPNSERAFQYRLLSEAISRMTMLSSRDDFYLDEHTGRHALELIGMMRGAFEVDPPKIFPQDAEGLSMTWSLGEIRRLMTISGDELSLLDLHLPTQVRCYYDIEDGAGSFPNLISILSETVQPRNSVAED